MAHIPALAERRALIEGAGLRALEVRPTLRGRWISLTLCERPAA